MIAVHKESGKSLRMHCELTIGKLDEVEWRKLVVFVLGCNYFNLNLNDV